MSLDELYRTIRQAQENGLKVALCHGVFDLLHLGHIRYLEKARALADLLVVTLTPDRFVDKGAFRPAFREELRLEAVAALRAVDHAALNRWPTAEETLRFLRPDVYVKGAEFRDVGADPTGKMELERRVAEEVGCRVAFVEDIVFSSSRLINEHLPIYPPETQRYLDGLRQALTVEEATRAAESFRDLRVQVVGDAILDEYIYVEALGKASKDPILATRHVSQERFCGGALAVANHLAAFVASVDLVTVLGDDGEGAFIEERLAPNVHPHFVLREDAPTVVKRRYVEAYSSNKLLSVYRMETQPASDQVVAGLEAAVQGGRPPDLTVCADYGHGCIPPGLVEVLCESSPFLAVNTQANAGNRGFHTVTRYRRADFVCLAEHEIRVETRDSEGALRPMMDSVAGELGDPLFIVTRGKNGCRLRTSDGTFHEAPALASKVVDRVGAGDAFFAVAALGAARGLPPELVALLGNAAGAQGVESVGNRSALDAGRLQRQLTALLK